MKTTYQKPETNVIDVKLQHQLMAGSGVNLSGGDVESVDLGGDYEDGEILSRGSGLWD